MNVLCVLFGHVPNKGWGGRKHEGYFQIISEARDGMGTTHARLIATCDRCDMKYQIGKIHMPKGY